ncbi:glutathione S-transferase family protein [Ideonella azotifigens]|uniref:Glutathione S-transferase family protein n=1 Tax=Ideonella azotifigens TaxID=513160 RepID=A0ABN1K166_9BURK|nr:glutathione S-transferase family protein [Ideonella azotifigens]MCD2341660.1 glutathione S-transferase family protein [Ideonella azotifigens]
MALTESTDTELVFYTHPWSRGGIVRWMLEEVGTPYRQQVLGFGPAMKDASYLALNPMGKVPTVVHRGQVVTECAAICAYLADAFPESGLAPANPDRADYYRWLFFAAGPLEAAVTNQSLKVDISPEQQRMVGYGTYEHTLDTLARALKGKRYIAGDRFSAADVYVGSHVMWGMAFNGIPKRPEFEAYTAGLSERPAYQAAKAIDAELGEKLATNKG